MPPCGRRVKSGRAVWPRRSCCSAPTAAPPPAAPRHRQAGARRPAAARPTPPTVRLPAGTGSVRYPTRYPDQPPAAEPGLPGPVRPGWRLTRRGHHHRRSLNLRSALVRPGPGLADAGSNPATDDRRRAWSAGSQHLVRIGLSRLQRLAAAAICSADSGSGAVSWCISEASSRTAQCSAPFPSTKRMMWICL